MERKVKETIIAPVPRVPAHAQRAIAAAPPRLPLTQVLIYLQKRIHCYFWG